ncbi:MAG TPA: PAS domain-containing protein [Chloroflexota bacterium]|jgi:PAS domain S-box-containing protein|nr:PAS domain-containing protein [Chloroflexota bacterium]
MASPRPRIDETLLETFFERASDGALVVNRLRKVVAMNPAAGAITGWNERDLATMSCRSFGCRDERGRPSCQETCLAQRCIENGAADGPQVLRLTRADGGKVTVEATFVPLQPNDRRTGTCLMLMRDIGLLEHLDAVVRQREQEIAEKNIILRGIADQLSVGWRAAVVELRAGVESLVTKHARDLGDGGMVAASRVMHGARRIEATFAQLKAQLHTATRASR